MPREHTRDREPDSVVSTQMHKHAPKQNAEMFADDTQHISFYPWVKNGTTNIRACQQFLLFAVVDCTWRCSNQDGLLLSLENDINIKLCHSVVTQSRGSELRLHRCHAARLVTATLEMLNRMEQDRAMKGETRPRYLDCMSKPNN